jgi:hypothetical protein
MDGGEIAVLCRRGGRVAAAAAGQHVCGGGRNKRGAVEDWWPVIDMTSRLFVHNNSLSALPCRQDLAYCEEIWSRL